MLFSLFFDKNVTLPCTAAHRWFVMAGTTTTTLPQVYKHKAAPTVFECC